MAQHNPLRGRGSSDNPANRFEATYTDYDLDEEKGTKPKPDTKLIPDHTKNILSTNTSPDIPFEVSLNPYRGCEHGCIYCYARPTHEFLGFSAGLDFESRIMVKYDAAAKLEKKLQVKNWVPKTIVMSGVTDPYQPTERKLGITRSCLDVLANHRNPAGIITKNYLVTRDIDHLKKLAHHHAVSVTLSITTLNRNLARIMEPRTSSPSRRLKTIKELTEAGIPVGVNVAPIIPGLTDHECVQILEAAKEAGATHAGYTVVRLPHGVKDLFTDWLEQHYPDRKQKVIHKIKDLRGGKLNDSTFGKRFSGEGNYAQQISDLFTVHCNRLDYNQKRAPLSTDAFKHKPAQTELFGS